MAKSLPHLIFITLPFYALLVWVIGFVLFLGSLAAQPDEPTRTADGVVVLTGDSGRIEAGVALLRAGRAERMLISGVHPDVSRARLAAMIGDDAEMLECCVDLDRSAQNTLGNAREAAAWIQARQYGSIYLVTSNYHLPRSLLLFRRAVVGAEIMPHAVATQAPAGYLLREYNKYLITLIDGAVLGGPAQGFAIKA